MSRFKTAPITPNYSARIVARRKGSRVRFWDTATATLSKWTRDPLYVPPAAKNVVRLPDNMHGDYESKNRVLGKMTVAELRDLAKARGIKVPSKARKADIISALTN